jgi:hypothetical protein
MKQIAKIIDDKRNAEKRYTATRSYEDKAECNRKNTIAKRETRKKHRGSWVSLVSKFGERFNKTETKNLKHFTKIYVKN